MHNDILSTIGGKARLFYKKAARVITGGFGKRERASALLSFFLILFAVGLFFIDSPNSFPRAALFEVKEGMTLKEVASRLAVRNLIRSPLVFTFSVRYMFGGDEKIHAGEYYFAHPVSALTIADMMTSGDYGLTQIAVTIPEGATVRQMGDIFESRLSEFDAKVFARLARDEEGYLFPDTYFLPPAVSEQEIIQRMKGNFLMRVEDVEEEIRASGHSLEEIVVMASLIEKEASLSSARRKISGILWKRLDIGMPLQVDAVFPYIIGRNTYEVTAEDLRYDSPYNTYKYAGLPPGPIANPGLDALHAALRPEETDYLYYLADRDGNTYYSETFEEHKRKSVLYLN